MKYVILLLLVTGCASTTTIKPVEPAPVSATQKPQKYPKSLIRSFIYDAKQEDELSRATTLKIKKDGTFESSLKSLSNDTRTYEISSYQGTWTYGDKNTLSLITEKASCRYAYANSKELALTARPIKSLTRKVIEGDETAAEFCRYVFNPCKKGECF
jgi:hypothetical protein